MTFTGRRTVAAELVPEALRKRGGTWLIEADSAWAWTLWRSDSDEFEVLIVCGSVGIWEEWAELSASDRSTINTYYQQLDTGGETFDALAHAVDAIAKRHICG
ncbi:MAG: hypothetical protein WC054_03685 [Candidatus Nanopelagicales bacterium]